MKAWSPECIVVSILILLVLMVVGPGVLSTREQARQLHREDRLKQVGLSLNNYHDTFGTFPATAAGPKKKKATAPKQPRPSEQLISPL